MSNAALMPDRCCSVARPFPACRQRTGSDRQRIGCRCRERGILNQTATVAALIVTFTLAVPCPALQSAAEFLSDGDTAAGAAATAAAADESPPESAGSEAGSPELSPALLQPGKEPATAGSESNAADEGNPPATQETATDAVPAVPGSPQQIVQAIGVPFTVIFVAASVIALWCGIERLVLLRRRRVIPRTFVDRFLQHLRTGRMDKPNAIAVCQQDGSPMADVFLHGVRKWGKPSVEVEQAVIDGGERQVAILRKRLRVLNGVATLCPLIGLLGTVFGMIESFNDIARSNAMGQAEQLAGGIAMALLTTAAGLMIAIPSLAAYMYLAGRVDALVVEMDRLGQELVYLISAEALRERDDVVPIAEPPRTKKK